MQWLVLSRDYLQGSTELNDPRSTLRTSFPLPSLGAGPNSRAFAPRGHREAPLLTFNQIRVPQVPLRCKHLPSANRLYLQHLKDSYPRNILRRHGCPVETLSFLWETAAPGSLAISNAGSECPLPNLPAQTSSSDATRRCPWSSSTTAFPSRTTSRVSIPASRATSSSFTTSEKNIASPGVTSITFAIAA